MADTSLRLLLMLQQISREPSYISSQQLHERIADVLDGMQLRRWLLSHADTDTGSPVGVDARHGAGASQP